MTGGFRAVFLRRYRRGVFGFVTPEEDGLPPRLVARFFNRDGTEVFSIDKNIVIIRSDAFDVQATGRSFTVRSALYKVDLEISLYPPTRIVINRLQWRYGKWSMHANDGSMSLQYEGSERLRIQGGHTVVSGPVLFDCHGEGNRRPAWRYGTRPALASALSHAAGTPSRYAVCFSGKKVLGVSFITPKPSNLAKCFETNAIGRGPELADAGLRD